MDLINRSASHAVRRFPVVYAHHTCVPHRDAFWDELNKALLGTQLPVGITHGRCHGYENPSREHLVGGAPGWRHNAEAFKDFDFCMSLEHTERQMGYVTEKSINCF